MKKKQFPGVKILVLIVQFGVVTSLLITTPSLNAQSNWEIGARFGDNIALDINIPLAAAPCLHSAVYFVKAK